MTLIAILLALIGVAIPNIWLILFALILYELDNGGRGIIAMFITRK